MFKWGSASITARELTIADDDAILKLRVKLPEGSIANSGQPFAEFMVGAVIDGDSPVPLVQWHDAAETIQASYQVWTRLPRRFMRQWQTELDATEAASPNGSA